VTKDEEEAQQRSVRIDHILEELKLKTDDLHELARQAKAHARQMVSDSRAHRRFIAEERTKFKKA
jgi:hypothetical protein